MKLFPKSLFEILLKISTIALIALSTPSFADNVNIANALQSDSRSADDKKLDDLRHPADVLEFLGVEPGMAVFDIFAGGGYYTEILSHVVGSEGRVTHYNNAPWAAFVKQATDKRFSAGKLANVEMLVASPESLANQTPDFDAAIFVLGMHDVYYADPGTGWVSIDKDKFAKGMFNLLKPGGVLGVIDHNAVPGTDPAVVGKSVHRVDPAVIIADLTAAGFVLEATSELLANPQDDKTTSVFLPENRFNTDRSLLKFRKPL
jgi:predicted methyltransferase